ncbi:ABC transporter substrate-binding protein [Bosea caraganae]|uniref:ABC transporter substrate-binding protein n=1 Tax=Bosea caraganae TaxID=2763117 RepID=A0A370L055_9HYPH|nr:ABC transporter substrate-binding protein [Bosea caraganae]RDJ20633.1 ABC transporter substrate-binding protein [Bosea caraganae]RDJ28910.1 ABC transporter substrate-binding protein [Bosea caraganae]
MIRMICLLFALLFGLPAQAQQKVVFAFGSDGFLFLPYYVAVGAGYFEREGIKPELVVLNGGPLAMAAILSGDADVMGSGIHLNIEAQMRKQDVKAFAALVTHVPSQLIIQGDIAKKAGITEQTPIAERLKLLKGLRIGITGVGSSTDKFLRSMLNFVKIDPERDVTIVPMGTAAPLLAAFSQKRIDAYVFSSPTAETGRLKFGGATLVNLGSGEFEPLKDFLYNCLTARADWLKKNAETTRKIVRATTSALELIQKDPEAAQKAALPFFDKLDPALYKEAYRQSMSSYPLSPRIDEPGVEANYVFEEEAEGKRPNVDPKVLYTNDYIEPAKR